MTVKTIEQLPVATSAASGDLLLLRQGGVSKSIDATLLGGGGGAVTSVAGRTGDVVLTNADVGLTNVDNTSDINKPVSTAQAAADAAVLAASAPIAHVGAGGGAHANVVASGAAGFITGADKAKLDGVASGATANTGTVTSVALSTPTGLTTSGSPVTSSGTLTISYTAGYSIPTTASQSDWDTAFTNTLRWDGGATGLVAATGRTSLGATTVGGNLFTLTNPSAVTFPRFNADNTISALDAATFRTAIGAGTGVGTVTSTSVVSANGFAGSVATATSTPAITISTTVTGLVKGNGTALAAATVRTDYAEPTTAMATGILKNTTGTGAHTIAVAGDFPTLNQSTTGSAASLTTPRTIGGSSFDGTANVTSFPAPGDIGGTTPSTGAFTTLSATGNVTVTGTVTVNKNSFSADILPTGAGVGGANVLLRLKDDSGTVGANTWEFGTRATGDNLSIANVSSGQISFTLTNSGNVGIGVTPIAGAGTLQFQAGTLIGSHGDNFNFASATKYEAGWKYVYTGVPALRYAQLAGNHTWYTAPAGTAGDPITFTQAMTLDASGNLTVTGTVTAPTFSGALSGSIAAATGLTSGQVVTALGYTPSAAASRTVSVISTNTTAVSGTTYVLTAALTLTLPASPSPGAYVPFSNRSGGSSCIIGRNGQPIMGLAEDMTLDATNVGGELVYADATRGWVLI